MMGIELEKTRTDNLRRVITAGDTDIFLGSANRINEQLQDLLQHFPVIGVVFKKNLILDIFHYQITISLNISILRFFSLRIKCCQHRRSKFIGRN